MWAGCDASYTNVGLVGVLLARTNAPLALLVAVIAGGPRRVGAAWHKRKDHWFEKDAVRSCCSSTSPLTYLE